MGKKNRPTRRSIKKLLEDRLNIPNTYNSKKKLQRMPKSNERYDQWGISNGNKFYPTFPTTMELQSGYYELSFSQDLGIFFERKDVSTDELFTLPSTELSEIIEDIEKFWERTDKYEEYNFIHKRGILLYGKPGCGKSAIIQLCTKYLIEEKDGIVMNITTMEQMEWYSQIITKLRQIEPDRPLIVIMEDLDGLAKEGSWATSIILNLLDGIKQVNNVVYIATTNYPERLEERITNRPSRFDRRYEVQLPNEKVRREYLTKKLVNEDLEDVDLEDWVTATEGYSLSHLKELVISVAVMDNTFKETIDRLDTLNKTPEIKSGRKNVGFGYE